MTAASNPTSGSDGNAVTFEPVDRLIELVNRETQALKANDWSGLTDFNRRKNQGLLELRRALHNHSDIDNGHVLQNRLRDLQSALRDNADMLQRHLDAARAVSQMISEAALAAQSDGTYSDTIAVRKDT